METGIKHDLGKPRMELLDGEFLEGVAMVLTFGAKKYAAHNWRNGLSISRTMGATLRHIFAFLRGEDFDKETGLHHLLHAGCELMFTYWTVVNKPDLDDRYKPVSSTDILQRQLIDAQVLASKPGEWIQVNRKK